MNSKNDNSQKQEAVSEEGTTVLAARVSRHVKLNLGRIAPSGSKGIQGVASMRPVKSLKRKSFKPTPAWTVSKKAKD